MLLGSQHVVGVRIFVVNIKKLTLQSITGEEWIPGEIKESVCNHAKFHGKLAPVENCTCGIWSCKSRKLLVKTFIDVKHPTAKNDFFFYYAGLNYPTWTHFVSAQVEQWGVVIEHETGWRSEYARIIPETIQVFPRAHKQVKLIAHLRAKYAQKGVSSGV